MFCYRYGAYIVGQCGREKPRAETLCGVVDVCTVVRPARSPGGRTAVILATARLLVGHHKEGLSNRSIQKEV